ncbi:MAG: hypothetical protein JXA73_24015 [Acidobacteria bacterium]|nr:hypothetical protein [Acidobacteriota bacterium]
MAPSSIKEKSRLAKATYRPGVFELFHLKDSKALALMLVPDSLFEGCGIYGSF